MQFVLRIKSLPVFFTLWIACSHDVPSQSSDADRETYKKQGELIDIGLKIEKLSAQIESYRSEMYIYESCKCTEEKPLLIKETIEDYTNKLDDFETQRNKLINQRRRLLGKDELSKQRCDPITNLACFFEGEFFEGEDFFLRDQ